MNRKFAFIGVWLTCLVVGGISLFGLPYSDDNLANVDDSNQKSAVKAVDNLNDINTQLTNGISVQQKAGTTNDVNIVGGSMTLSGDVATYPTQIATVSSTNVSTNIYTLAATTNNVDKVCVSVEGTAGDALIYMAGTSSGAAVRSLNRCYTANNDGTGGFWEQKGYKGAVTVISVGGTATNNFYITRTTY